MSELAVETALGLAAGIVAGMFGVGGGLLFVPVLTLVAGLSQLEAQATSLAAMIPVVVVGALRQHHYGNVDWKAASTVGIASALGVAAGTAIATSVPEDLLRTMFAVLLLVVAAHLLWMASRRPRRPAGPGAKAASDIRPRTQPGGLDG